MPWSEVSVMDLRLEFVMLAEQPGSNVLCVEVAVSGSVINDGLQVMLVAELDRGRLCRQTDHPANTPLPIRGVSRSRRGCRLLAVLAVRSDHPSP